LAGVVIRSFREPRAERIAPREPALNFAIMFGFVLIVAALYADYRHNAQEAMQKIAGMLVLYYLIIRVVREQRQVEVLLLAIICSTLFSSLVVIYDNTVGESLLATSDAARNQSFAGEVRSSGASDNDPTTAASMVLAGTLLALFLAIKTPKWRWLNLVTVATGSTAVMFSFARSSALAYGIAIAWFILKYRKHPRFPIVIVLALSIAAMSAPFVPAEYWDRLTSLSDIDTDESLQRRYTYNVIGLELFVENPLVGVGPGNFRRHYLDQEFRWLPGRTLHPRNLHNMYMSVAAETGLFGILCFLAILLAALVGLQDVRTRARSPRLRLIAEAMQFAFVGYLIASAFTPNEYTKYTWILAAISIAMTRLADIEKPSVPLLFGKRS